MREVKYRAWDKNGLMMHKVFRLCLGCKKAIFENELPDEWQYAHKYEDIELMLYSCIKDSQGIEIYEGDILLKPYWDPFADKMLKDKFVVEWRDGGLKARQMKDDFPLLVVDVNSEESTIVGNIYEKNT